MIVGIGVDIVEVRRISKALQGSASMVRKVFTPAEIEYCQARKNQYQHFAGRFAAKEAALKALGTGWQEGIGWRDVEVIPAELGKPDLKLHGKALSFFKACGADRAFVSITHAEAYATAMVVLEGNNGGPPG